MMKHLDKAFPFLRKCVTDVTLVVSRMLHHRRYMSKYNIAGHAVVQKPITLVQWISTMTLMTLRVVTARVFLRPQWFFYVPPILVSNEVWRDGTSFNLISEPLKV